MFCLVAKFVAKSSFLLFPLLLSLLCSSLFSPLAFSSTCIFTMYSSYSPMLHDVVCFWYTLSFFFVPVPNGPASNAPVRDAREYFYDPSPSPPPPPTVSQLVNQSLTSRFPRPSCEGPPVPCFMSRCPLCSYTRLGCRNRFDPLATIVDIEMRGSELAATSPLLL